MNEATAPTPSFGAERTDAVSVQAGEVVRHLTHELRQPLSTIESIAFYLRMVLREEPRALEQLGRVQQLVEQMNWVLSDAVHLIQAAPTNPQVLDLHELLTQALSDRPDSSARLQPDFTEETVLVRLDAAQAGHLIRSVILILSALAKDQDIIVRTRAENGEAFLEFLVPDLDAGQADLDRLFEPFAPGLISGAGMSLAGAKRIAEFNGGRMQARSESGRGTLLRSAFPLAG
ncbi:MAG: HAMP domain-containing histidine kinase [Acidobacteria bacterium]|nr:HAMP domain-containing histidine kinase [Acidobacteriota bacterium]